MKTDVDGFGEVIDSIRQKLREARYNNESAIREAIILPVLTALGWDTTDPTLVKREYSVKSYRVDYALFVRATSPEILIEAKAIGSIQGGDQQLFEYAFHEGVPMTLLTDGQQWKFYLPSERGSYEERCVYALDMLERDTTECCRILSRYLRQSRVASREAIADARRDHEAAAQERTAAGVLPTAWAKLVKEEEQQLIDLLSDQAEILCGHRPTQEQVTGFLITLASGPVSVIGGRTVGQKPRLSVPVPSRNGARPAPVIEPTVVPVVPDVREEPKGRRVRVVLDGTATEESSAMAALLKVLRHLAAKDPTFLERLSTRLRGRTRNIVARSPEEVYFGRPDFTPYAAPVVNGWFIDTNIYPVYAITRKSFGVMMRKLSVTLSHSVRQFFGTSWHRKVSSASLKSAKRG